MAEPTDFEVTPLRKGRRTWLPLVVSGILHVLIIASLVLAPLPAPDAAADNGAAAETQNVAIPRLPSPKAPAQKSQPKPPTPKETPLGPDTDKPDEPPKEKGPERPPPDPDQIDASKKLAESAPPVATPAPDKTPPAPDPAEEQKMRFIQGPSATTNGTLTSPTSTWGRPTPNPAEAMAGTAPQPEAKAATNSSRSAMGRVGFDPSKSTNAWQPSFKDAAGQCPAIPDLGLDASGKPVLAVVQGRVYWDDHRTPLAGAQLQIVGTSFTTFSNNEGEYTLRFDPRVLEKCKIQYVRVRADGFRGALLTLSIGERIRSDDVVLRRN